MLKERPILFSAPMVRAILNWSKTQTRRVLREQPQDFIKEVGWTTFTPPGKVSARGTHPEHGYGEWFLKGCPFGQPGDELWVRETWRPLCEFDPSPETGAAYWADSHAGLERRNGDAKWRPSIHMPRWASRITLTVKAVRVERLQDISEADAIAEGVELTQQSQGLYYKHPSDQRMTAVASLAFQWLWESINGPDSRDANPWVWVLDFERKAVG